MDYLSPLHLMIGIEGASFKNKWFDKKEYLLKPEIGKGTIEVISFDDISISIKKMHLKDDVLLRFSNNYNGKHLSFLLKGEIIFKNDLGCNDLIYTDNDSCMICFSGYNGLIKVSGNKQFHEITIKLSDTFLSKHQIDAQRYIKQLNDPDSQIIIPMTAEPFNIINDLNKKNYKGISQKVYLESKILELIAVQIDSYLSYKASEVKSSTSCNIKKIYDVTQILRIRMHENLGLKDLSLAVGINEHLLKKEFKRVFGSSVSVYALKLKMQKAKQLLEATEKPIYEISEEVGYKNATHFSAAFKKFYGKTPKRFRDSL